LYLLTWKIDLRTVDPPFQDRRPRPAAAGESRQSLIGRAISAFAALTQALRARGHDPQEAAHFVNRLVFCVFAEDAGLLPNEMFPRMLEHERGLPLEFAAMASELFGKMATGGRMVLTASSTFDRMAQMG